MLKLKNSDVNDMVTAVETYKSTVENTFYNLYKNIYKLSKTNNFRGKTADTYKSYLETVTINYLKAFLNIAGEASTVLKDIRKCYIDLEPKDKGRISSDTLESVRDELEKRKESFEHLVSEIEKINSVAANYISVKALNNGDIDDEFNSLIQETANIDTELENADRDALKLADSFLDHINELKYSIDTIQEEYHVNGRIQADKVGEIKVQGWYKDEIDTGLKAKLAEDPFAYEANGGAVYEDQWAAGLTSDIYGKAGYTVWGRQYSYGRDKNIFTGDISGKGAGAYINGQFTDYLKGNIDASALNGSASGKLGWNDKYKGFNAKGQVALVEGNASAVLGTDNFNGYVKASASALSAKGNVAFEFEEDGFDVGFGGKLSLGEAKASIGTSLLSVPASEENKTSKTYANGKIKTSKETSVLSGSIGVKATAGVSADLEISGKKVAEVGPININAVSLKASAALLLGVDIDVTIPLPSIDW